MGSTVDVGLGDAGLLTVVAIVTRSWTSRLRSGLTESHLTLGLLARSLDEECQIPEASPP